jgi:hypothetical protein
VTARLVSVSVLLLVCSLAGPGRQAAAQSRAPAAPTSEPDEPLVEADTPMYGLDPETVEGDRPLELEAPQPAQSPDGAGAGAAAGAGMPAPLAPRTTPTLFGGYVDLGFFVPQGNGAGWIQDSGAMRLYPQYVGRYSWVFLGDIMAPAVNTRGEPADLGDAPDVTRADSVDSNGAMSFIVNEINLTASSALASNVLATASLNFTPRTGAAFSWGDTFDADIAQIEWLPGARQRTSIFVGKFDSVIGIEYRERKASQRFGITPSLLARYTTGTPVGIKVRTKLGGDDQLVLAAALTNGSSVIEPFHFYDEVDSNDGKTASGRASWRLPLPFELEVGLSGLWGPQDRALDSREAIWFWGVDLLGQLGAVAVKGQWLRGGAKGETDRLYDERHRPYGLDLKGGAYLELDAALGWGLGLLVRGEYRDALVTLGVPTALEPADRIYVTKSWRATFGARVTVSDRLSLKAEYLRNGEYGGVPAIANDVFTSSCVWIY